MPRDVVLVVDDDPDFRELVAICVEDYGLTCVAARCCTEALSLAERYEGRIRAVLLDYFMPGLPPCQCASEIRARLDPAVPVVLVSAAVDIAERAAEVGLTCFLAKPFDMAQLRKLFGGAPAAGV